MTTQEIATQLVALCKKGEFEKAQTELYAAHAVSIEPDGSPNQKVEGLDAIKKKGEWWQENVVEVHSNEISEPIVAENFFSLSWKMNVTMKDAPGPMQMDEICVYEVNDGKIVREQFFHTVVEQPAAAN